MTETQPPTPLAVGERQAIAGRVAEAMAEGDGHWTPCTGCQESVDGCVSTTDYPYDPTFQCQPGGGCGECGGIGVTWTPAGFYDGYAEFAAAQERTHEAVARIVARAAERRIDLRRGFELDALVERNWKLHLSDADAILSLDSPSLGETTERRSALERMVACDEELEQEHPGWMTGQTPTTNAPVDAQDLTLDQRVARICNNELSGWWNSLTDVQRHGLKSGSISMLDWAFEAGVRASLTKNVATNADMRGAAEEYAYNPDSPRASNSRDSWVDPEAAFIAGADWFARTVLQGDQ